MATTDRKYDLYGTEFRADPACVFAQMREQDPVLRQPGIDGETPIWFVTRHDDVAAVLLDDERFVRDPRNALSAEELAERDATLPLALAAIENHMLNRDGDAASSVAPIATTIGAPCVLASERPSHPGDERHAAKPS